MIEQNPHRDPSLFALARRAAMSTRTLSRRFREHVAALSGFASATMLRAQFQQVVGSSPKTYRRPFRGSGT